ncbi:NAD-dependent epimerase/dehydratase family protein [Oleiharenicola lentus]|jgi:UDP-glucose 4-epimerase|uniref:NAD-dependent epimerase/dehydratase family protein n=1 Tax=Oleiharenicola lentus TaxID=2508720 RepID=A0A4Q1CAV3_9BACT|nr:NAD-dependent epimerase/dehydratase family protein [Oleiharenicola lentus]RXK56060.1 NAD-dependent epimerase/dehydratase family protein [Oleiharenicola lentus]
MKKPAPSFAKAFKGKRVLITGGLGFIGSNLARTLVKLGAKVTLLDSLIPEYGGNRRNVRGIEAKTNINLADVRDRHSLPEFLRGQEFLFNLAGQTSHMDSMTDPETDLEINCRAQLTLLEACRKHNPRLRVVFASTRQIYGRPDYLPVDEKHPLRPVDVNGINKLAGEEYHLLYSQVHGVPSTVLRLTNTIGPRMRVKDARQTFVGVWIKQILEEKPVEVWGGTQLRDFTYVDDAVEAFLVAATHPQAVGKVFNLGGVGRISLRDLAALLVDVAGQGSYTVREFPADRRKIDIGDYYSDCGLIERELGWKPKTNIRQALAKTVAYYRKELPHYL